MSDLHRFVNYLRRKAPAPGTQMESAVRYIRTRDRQRAASSTTTATTTATATATASSSSSSSSSSSTTPSVSAANQRAKTASQFVAFVSGRRSLSAVEMQAKIRKLVPPKPAFPGKLKYSLN